ncbi:hypothetical protein PVAG01_05918 [Phlyctema vagabunda]|uniref:Ankyrin repeat protein n=1 Tax=Phlyctema vagabunda TaxID=108571 RepID=A0ABR4PF87_9HELO
MVPGFGFSVGDFIAAAGLIKKVSDALKDAGGASSEYQHVMIELEGLDRALKFVAAIQPDQSNLHHIDAIRGMALSCQIPLQQFLLKIQKYESYLGPFPASSSISRSTKKAKWAVYVAGQVESLRAVVAAKVVSINLLLNVQISGAISKIEPAIREERNHLLSEILQVRQSMSEMKQDSRKTQSDASKAAESAQTAAISHEAALSSINSKLNKSMEDVLGGLERLSTSARSVETTVLNLRDTGQQILQFIGDFPREIRDLLQKIIRTNLQLYYLILRSQNNIAKVPTMLLESNILFEDALGRTQTLPYEWFRHWDTFEGLLKTEFKGIPGESNVLGGSYHLLDTKNRGQIIRKEDWSHRVTPGSTVLMSMIMTQLRLRRGVCPRPSCNTMSFHAATSDPTISCSNCGLHYSLMTGLVAEESKVLEIEDEESYVSQRQAEEDARVFGERMAPSDLEVENSVQLPQDFNKAPVIGGHQGVIDLSNLTNSMDPMDIDDPEQKDVSPNTFSEQDDPCNRAEALDPNQRVHGTPLGAWLSKIPMVDTAQDISQKAGFLAPENDEAHGIESFRHVHISYDDNVSEVQQVASEPACTDGIENITFAARIFYRNIRDRYPQIPHFLAHRLAKANKKRAERLEVSRLEHEQNSHSEGWDEESEDSNLNKRNGRPLINRSALVPPFEIDDALIDSSSTRVDVQNIPETPSSKREASESNFIHRNESTKTRLTDTDTSYWSGAARVPSANSSASGSSKRNSSLHGYDRDRHSPASGSSKRNSSLHGYDQDRHSPVSRSTTTDGGSSKTRSIQNHQKPLLTLPPPPIVLSTQQSFTCDICGRTINVLRKRDWKKHVFQDLEPFMCTFQDCKISDKTYASRRAFMTHEMKHHREIFRKLRCNRCNQIFNQTDLKAHSVFCAKSSKMRHYTGKRSQPFSVVQKRIADSICPFCAELITGGSEKFAQHLGHHLEEISFAVVRKPYEEWQFYEDSVSAKSLASSSVLNDNIVKAAVEGDLELVTDLIKEGFDVNTIINSSTLLHIASESGVPDSVRILLQNGANQQIMELPAGRSVIWADDKPLRLQRGLTALELAVVQDHVEVVTLLANAASNDGLQHIGNNALLLAATLGRPALFKEILNCFDKFDDNLLTTCFHLSIRQGHREIISNYWNLVR